MRSPVNRRLFIEVVGIVLLSAVAAVFAAGEIAHKVYSPLMVSSISRGIHPDGWVEDGAVLELKNLAQRSNYLDISWDPWRPEGKSPAQMTLSVCGEPASVFAVTSREPMRVYLKGACEPRVVTFEVLNPFDPVGEDNRSLAAKMTKMQINSRFGVPLRSFEVVSEVFGALLLLALCAWFALRRSPYGLAAAFATLVVSTGFLFSTTAGEEKVYPLWLFCAAILGGCALASFHSKDESRESSLSEDISRPLAWAGLSLVVLLGLMLRGYGLNFGLPANFHPDEVPKVNAIMRMVAQGNLDPGYFLHPSLLLYCTYGMTKLLLAFGYDATFRETAFFAGRVVSLTAGVASIPLLYAIGSLLFKRVVGLSGALLLAVFPLHVTCSRYLKEDALLTFWILTTVLCVVCAVRKERPWLLIFSGLAAGITAGTKYSGMLIGLTALGAPWIVSRKVIPDKRYLTYAILGLALIPIGFFITTPYSVFNSEIFLRDFRSESRHMQTGHTTAIDSWSQLWMYHFARSLLPGMGYVCALAAVASVGFLLRKRRIEGLVIVGLVCLYYLPAEYVKAKPAPQPERYVVPCLPFLAICCAAMFSTLLQRVRPVYVVAVTCLFAIAPLLRSAELGSEVAVDTRLRMAQWIRENIPPGSTIMMDWKPYNPNLDGENFKIVYIERANILKELNARSLRRSGGQYMVLSSLFYDRYFSQPEVNASLRQKIREVFDQVPVVMQMRPLYGTYGFHNPMLTVFSLAENDFQKLDQELLARRKGDIDVTSNQMRARPRW